MPQVDVIQGDCLKHLSHLSDRYHFSLAFADPPYNNGTKYDSHNDSLPHEDYLDFTSTWITQLKQLIPNNKIFIYPPKMLLLDYWNLIPENHLLICGFSASGRFWKGNFIHQYIPLLAPPGPLKKLKDHWMNIPVPAQGWYYHENRYDHPAQTSLAITRKVIEHYTKEDDWVLDPFGGCGTTAEACVSTNRNCVLIEISKKYVSVIEKRLINLFNPSVHYTAFASHYNFDNSVNPKGE